MKKWLLIIAFLCKAGLLFAQKEKSYIHKGNKLYSEGKFKEAEETYRKSLVRETVLPQGNFNLGDALYKQKKFADAAGKFNDIAATTKDSRLAAGAYHNLGNTLFQEKKLEESIVAYKKALRRNPSDDQTRYNLAYAQEMLKKQQQQKKNDDKKKDDKSKDDKDKKDDKNKNNNDDKDKDKQQQPAPTSQPDQVSKEDAERMLEALNNQEQATQEKLKNQKLKGPRMKTAKDW
jgi:tetratricopeptide (TPR) repeat protein